MRDDWAEATPQVGRKSRYHHGSHQKLLKLEKRVSAGSGVDAIVVPTVRPPSQLAVAADLAAALRCPLVTLHSRDETLAAAAGKEIRAEVDLFPVDVASDYELPQPVLATSNWIADRFPRKSDLSTKRNLALILGCLAGWSKIFLLDDDMTEVEPEDVRKASRLLDSYDAAGLVNVGFPDNSVVCHAYRLAGGHQSSFVGGGALVIETTRCGSFFPEIYNDDWFYLLDDNERLHPTAVTGRVVQADYDPFLSPERARSEEFGNVLAEGLYWLLDKGQSISDADEKHWNAFLARRRRFVTGVLRSISGHALTDAEKVRRIDSLNAALERLGEITPRLCAEYMELWRQDRAEWQRHIKALYAPGTRLADALRGLLENYGPGLTWVERRAS